MTGWKDNAPEGFKLMAITKVLVRTMMNNRELDITDQWQSAENWLWRRWKAFP